MHRAPWTLGQDKVTLMVYGGTSGARSPETIQQARFTDECKFRERFQENSYNTYASAVYRTAQTGREWYVALNKRGKAKRGCSPRVKPQHVSTHFLPRIQQPKLPELSFTVTVPEKKKPPAALPKPKVSVTASQKSTRPVRYKLKFRFG
uniref:Fibroblast growth factor 5 isoform X2 n=1 Tax=Geotrypetes seraphini TaxID=260995 RepID=A0A6P8RAM1_GEOSA|nr:fibroblast growth factor 5 isoform X2 [Geotrypetes seraphini]